MTFLRSLAVHFVLCASEQAEALGLQGLLQAVEKESADERASTRTKRKDPGRHASQSV